MCGIAGIYHLDGQPASSVQLKRMTDILAHRGPDGEGHYIDGDVGLGHRRLAILDLSPAGHQPMSTADGRFVISYNGEVYNYRELRTQLESLGHHFRSRTDSEVVLHAFVEWGERALNRFNGMFAFAIWDRREHRLFLARDRYGVKPLYYTVQNNTLLFASEVKGLLAHSACETALDREALYEYFTFQNFYTERTLWKEIKSFPAGCFLQVTPNRAISKPVCYWDFNFSETETTADDTELAEELTRLFKQAVNRQLVSDVDVGSYLSGGMDSGSVAAVAASQLPYMCTFTCGFDLSSASGLELAFDERARAEAMSYQFKTEHYEMVLKAGDMERVLPRLTWHLEEPRVGQSYPNFYAAQLASKFVKVVLAGTGGDEMFGGYPWRYYRAAVNNSFDEYVDKYYAYWMRMLDQRTLGSLFRPLGSGMAPVDTREIFGSIFLPDAARMTRPEDYINHSMYFEAKTFLHGLLTVEDKLSMAHGLETRVPFLDNDLVDFAMRVPVRLKLANLSAIARLNENEAGNYPEKYFRRSNDGKLLLRQAMKKILPAEITGAEKQGFSAPDASWFKGESIDFVRDTLCSSSSPIYEYLDHETVRTLIGEHLEGNRNRRLLIWSLLNFDCWLKTFLGQTVLDSGVTNLARVA